jgi:serine/threonine-protein kinase
MPLQPGEKLGPYEILSAIGAGGMGEVYKARDTRLDRTVAVKVLPEHIAKREDLRARFEREARAVASLNHPNICVLHDIGNQDGAGYMVMEYMEGATLAARIEKGALPLDQALKLATQIADALDRAHRAGVTHRDVKPQNIMLTRDGVKVLDFGLAKSSAKPAPTEDTLTKVLTTEGTVLGTPQYMAPEQFEGKEADARSDIWAFGAVLYEMVSGQKAFQGKNYSSLVGAILASEPAPMPVKPFTPSWLERLVRRCLAKDPEDRWQSMRDLVLELRTPPEESTVLGPSKTPWWPWIAAGALAVVASVALWALWRAQRAPDRPLLRFDADLGPDARHGAAYGAAIALFSPDGQRVVYSSSIDGRPMLAMRLLSESKGVVIPGTENGADPFFSPDGQWIAFFADGKLKKTPLRGGATAILANANNPRGGVWGQDGVIVAALNNNSGLVRLDAVGGAPKLLTHLEPGAATHRWPQLLPDGKTILFTSSGQLSNYEEASVQAVDINTGRVSVLHTGGYFGRWASSGHLLYMHDKSLFAIAMDLRTLSTRGVPVPVLSDVGAISTAGAGQFDLSATGTLVYRSGVAGPTLWSLALLDRTGKPMKHLFNPGAYLTPRYSPNGRSIALASQVRKGMELYRYDIATDRMSPLTFAGGMSYFPVWSADGRHLVFSVFAGDMMSLYWIRSDGSGQPEKLLERNRSTHPGSISPDGRLLAIDVLDPATHRDIWTVPMDLADTDHPKLGEPVPFARTPANEYQPAFSPDGRWLAYVSDESGVAEVYVRPYPEKTGSGRWQVSSEGGMQPIWARDGKSLYFETLTHLVMTAPCVTNGDSFTLGKPKQLTQMALADPNGGDPNYDVIPDGSGILGTVENPDEARGNVHVTFLLNFTDELRRKVPVGQ